jgi:6-phosphofructokinase 1
MNAAIRAVVRRAIACDAEVVGFMHGYAGLMRGESKRLTSAAVSDIIQRGGTILRTARAPEFSELRGQTDAARTISASQIDGLIVVGGGGTVRGAMLLDKLGVPVVAIPSTIDNDLIGTDVTIGHHTAVDTVVEAINRIRDTATSHERIFVVEVMGRDTGFIALNAGVAGGAESILIPEIPVSIEHDVCRRIVRAHQKGKTHSLIVVSEGVGHGFDVARTIQDQTHLETRWTVLGHVQRGGSPVALDRIMATRLGSHAVDLLLSGTRGVQVGLVGGATVTTALAEVAAQRRQIDLDLYRLASELAI